LDGGHHLPLCQWDQMLFAILPRGPDVVQAFVRHHLLEQLLGTGSISPVLTQTTAP
jgi:hypothetical protein